MKFENLAHNAKGEIDSGIALLLTLRAGWSMLSHSGNRMSQMTQLFILVYWWKDYFEQDFDKNFSILSGFEVRSKVQIYLKDSSSSETS